MLLKVEKILGEVAIEEKHNQKHDEKGHELFRAR